MLVRHLLAFAAMLSSNYLTPDYYRSHSHAQAYFDLRADPTLSSLSDPNVWDLVAYIWRSNTTPDGLAEGQRLFTQNCAACHGESGGGDGVFAASVNAQTGKFPANSTDPASMLCASPALLQGKSCAAVSARGCLIGSQSLITRQSGVLLGTFTRSSSTKVKNKQAFA